MRIESGKDFLSFLVEKNVLEKAVAEEIIAELGSGQYSAADVLISKRILEPDVLFRLIKDLCEIDSVQDPEITQSSELKSVITSKFANHYRVLPLSIQDKTLFLGVSDPFDQSILREIRSALSLDVRFMYVPYEKIGKLLDRLYGVGARNISGEKGTETLSRINDIDLSSDETAIVGFVNTILQKAVDVSATDIHIEPYESEVIIRFRVDGILTDIPVPQNIKIHQAALITRVKVISGLDITEQRLPQDGRIKIRTEDGLPLDLRVSTLPTPCGEAVNIRLLHSAGSLDLDVLGFSDDELEMIKKSLKRSNGMIFLTGPTGSGKTTTLYSCLERINDGRRKIITLEDPIEYQIKGITQIQVQQKVGLTFGRGLRSVLRHDPDIILVGEVRDSETAEIAVRSSLTGHLVLSTLHTNDAVGAIIRLADMGVPPYLIASALSCVIAQRLVRRLCPECKENVMPGTEISELLPESDVQVFAPKGCESCSNTGYKGRTVIAEVLPITDELRRLIHNCAGYDEILDAVRKEGVSSLQDSALQKIIKGEISEEEFYRVIQG